VLSTLLCFQHMQQACICTCRKNKLLSSCSQLVLVESGVQHRLGQQHSCGKGPLQQQPAVTHLPLGSLPCMLATYLKLGSGSATPGLSDISKPHNSTPPALVPMLRWGSR
jgi:hypothetical protein